MCGNSRMAPIRNESVMVYLKALPGAVEPEGTIVMAPSYVNSIGEFEHSDIAQWPFHYTEECFYEVLAVQRTKDTKVPELQRDKHDD
jgi:hypothetical protein